MANMHTNCSTDSAVKTYSTASVMNELKSSKCHIWFCSEYLRELEVTYGVHDQLLDIYLSKD